MRKTDSRIARRPSGPDPNALAALFSAAEINSLLEAVACGRDHWTERQYNRAVAAVSIWAQRTRVNDALLQSVLDGTLAIAGTTPTGEPEFIGRGNDAGGTPMD
jgi:hypothetical protein